jgi:hypothetical protein
MSGGYSAPAFGILNTGFVPKITNDVVLDMTTAARAAVDPNLDLSASEPMGQIVQIMAAAIAEVWELLQETYNATNPNAAEGQNLYGIGSITGTEPEPATYSQAICNAVMSSNTSINAGLIASVNGQPSNTWQLLGACDSNGNLTSTTLTSTTAGTYLSLWQSTQTGPIAAAAGQLTVIASLPAGLTSITNPNDAILGTNTETDAAFRVRRVLELAAAGSESLDAINAAVLEASTQIISSTTYENSGDTVDAFGRPPHSIEVVIFDGLSPTGSDDNAIAQAMWNEKPGGIQFYSASGDSGVATDSQGNTHYIPFTRVSVVPIYIDITTVGATSSSEVQAAIAAWGSALGPGSAVYRLQLMATILPDGNNPVAGTTDVSACTLGTAPSPSGTSNLTFTIRQIPYIETTNISVTLT